jgi:hypothetical protein
MNGSVTPELAGNEFHMSTNHSTLDEEQMGAIEGRLAGTLRRVTPPGDFVQRLRGHIHMPERSEITLRIYDWERLLLVISGVLSGAVVILTLARALYHLVGRRDI